VLRATTAARLYLDGQVPTLAAAAEACGSNCCYVRAAITLLKADPSLANRAIKGWINLTETAEQVRKIISVDAAVASWAAWTPSQRREFGRGAGVADVWDYAISPVLAEDQPIQQAAE
jgi:hypothetical protein